MLFVKQPVPMFFIHIGKTAGVSFEHILKQNYPAASICPHYYNREYLAAPGKSIDYKLFWGHSWYFTLAIMPEGTHPTTFIRDPVQRVLSGFEHIMRDQNHGANPALTERLTRPRDIPDEPTFRRRWSNAQTRILGHDCDFSELLQRCREGAITPDAAIHEVQKLQASPADTDTLARAKMRLAEMSAFGITEQFDRSSRWISSQFKLRIKGSPPRLNTSGATRPRDEIYAKEDFDAVHSINALDQALYDYARELFERRAPAAK